MQNVVYEKHKFENILSITKLVTVFYFEFDKNFVFNGESHNFWEMVYVDRGEVIITADKRQFPLRQGELYFHRPGEFHKIHANGKTAPNVFVATFVCTSPIMKLFIRKKMVIPQNLKGFLSKFLDEVQNAFEFSFYSPSNNPLKPKKNSPLGSQQLVRVYLETFLILLLREKEAIGHTPTLIQSKEGMENHLTEQIIDYMKQHVFDKITIDDICKYVRYGKTYISTLFKAATGHTIIRYYTMLKVDEAKKMIREYRGNISEIADRLGYEDPRYFSKSFKRITGITPTEYSNSVKR